MKQAEFNKKFIASITENINDSELLKFIKNGSCLSAHRAIEVYREDYQVRLTEALKNTYRATHAILGDEDFFSLALEYLEKYPSTFSDLDEFGDQFTFFLKEHSIIGSYPFLSELAHFEWMFREIFHEREVHGLNSTDLQLELSDPPARLILVSSTRLLHYKYNISKLYSLKDNEEESIDYTQEQYLLLFKKNSLIKMHTLSKNQWEVMKIFHIPSSLLESVQRAPATMTPEEMSGLFQILGTEQILMKSL